MVQGISTDSSLADADTGTGRGSSCLSRRPGSAAPVWWQVMHMRSLSVFSMGVRAAP